MFVFVSGTAAAGWSGSPGCVIVASGEVCGGIPLALTIAQCQSWSGKRAKFKDVRKIAVVDGAADPFTRNSRVTSGCFWNESGACCGEPPATAGTIRA